jgi:hypothetical protein
MPAIERGLGLVDRVVRRHVAKLEKIGWCARIPAVRGEGMLVWMTATGLDGVGLGQLPAPRAPHRFSPQTMHGIRVAWAAADIEHAGHHWIAGRELALTPDEWGAKIANERGGYSRRLPDLVFWPPRDPNRHMAVVIHRGVPNPRRERAALQCWQRAIQTRQYAQVHYLAYPDFVSHLQGLARAIGASPQLIISDRTSADEHPLLASVIENVDQQSAA